MATRIEQRLTDVESKDGKTDEQLYQERLALDGWLLDTEAKKTIHRRRLQEDFDEDRKRPDRHPPGRRGGRRVRLVWAGTKALRAWRNEVRGLPGIGRRFALLIGGCAYETPATYDEDGNELTRASGRRYTEVQLSNREIHWFRMNGVNVRQAGSFQALQTNNDI